MSLNDQSVTKDYISQLPDELLMAIGQSLIDESWSEHVPKIELNNLLLASRRLNQVLTPVLYHRISLLGDRPSWIDSGIAILHRTFQENASLTSYVRQVDIHLQEPGANNKYEKEFSLIYEITLRLVKATKFSVNGSFKIQNRGGWALVKVALKNMPRLSHISIRDNRFAIPMAQCVAELADIVPNLPQLSDISLFGEAISRNRSLDSGVGPLLTSKVYVVIPLPLSFYFQFTICFLVLCSYLHFFKPSITIPHHLRVYIYIT